MKIVVADTGPLHYLVLIEEIELLPKLYESVFVPGAVCRELDHAETPPKVRRWIANPPEWLSIRDVPPSAMPVSQSRASLDIGEAEALVLATAMKADLLLMDERAGVSVARAEGFSVMGTLGILDSAARRGLIDLATAFSRLQTTTFHCRKEIMEKILSDYDADQNRLRMP